MKDIFCKIAQNEAPCRKIYEDEFLLAFLDIDPFSDGHTLIVPKKHIGIIFDADQDTLSKMINLTKTIGKKIKDTWGYDTIAFSSYTPVEGDPQHLHFHVVGKNIGKNSKEDYIHDEPDMIAKKLSF